VVTDPQTNKHPQTHKQTGPITIPFTQCNKLYRFQINTPNIYFTHILLLSCDRQRGRAARLAVTPQVNGKGRSLTLQNICDCQPTYSLKAFYLLMSGPVALTSVLLHCALAAAQCIVIGPVCAVLLHVSFLKLIASQSKAHSTLTYTMSQRNYRLFNLL